MFQAAWYLLFPKSVLVVLNSYSLFFFVAPVDKYLIKKQKQNKETQAFIPPPISK